MLPTLTNGREGARISESEECANTPPALASTDLLKKGAAVVDPHSIDYRTFLERKSQHGQATGFEPLWLPDYLFDFQRHLCAWAIRRGRAAIFASCGLGKTPLFLVWAENVVRHTNRPVLCVTTLGDSDQAIREAGKFQVEAIRSKDGKFPPGARVVVTNYERLHHFDPSRFAGCVANESSILKNFKGRRKAIITEFMRTLPYRLLCTATPSPNDYIELGTSSEALGELGFQDMLTRFFVKHLAARYTTGWGREQYRMKGHAVQDFWRWVCSWAVACRRPEDLGFDGAAFRLPELVMREHLVHATTKRPGCLFDMPATNMEEEREELRRTVRERCRKVAELVSHDRPALAWCYLNEEGKLLARLIPGAVEVSGADSDDAKEEKFEAFVRGQIRCLVSKPKICGFGLNWQHCAHMAFFPSHSWEMWHQAIHRCWRFGQQNPVTVDTVATEGTEGVLKNLQHKEAKVDRMMTKLVELMNAASGIKRTPYEGPTTRIPQWL
jgi:hypothetical protein